MTQAELLAKELNDIWAQVRPKSRKGTYGTSYRPSNDEDDNQAKSEDNSEE